MPEATAAEFDLGKLEADIAALTPEEIQKQLLEIRTKQKVNQKKYHNPERAKAYHAKKNATVKALMEKAKQLGIYDAIKEQAAKAADEQLAKEAAVAQAEIGEEEEDDTTA